MTAYQQGFIDKCAELDIDPNKLIESAQKALKIHEAKKKKNKGMLIESAQNALKIHEANKKKSKGMLIERAQNALKIHESKKKSKGMHPALKALIGAGVLGGGAYAGYRLAPESTRENIQRIIQRLKNTFRKSDE
jgi:hypothetical protein